jgi:hypothetical protein
VLRQVLRDGCAGRCTPTAARVIRFDFHWTADGWKISEANSDVPGGYSEASSFPRAMSAHYPGTRLTADPAGALVGAVGAHVRRGGCVALLAAPGYMEDQQVIAFLAERLGAQGIAARCCEPLQLRFDHAVARLETSAPQRVDAIVRFFQGEWLVGLSRRCGWPILLANGSTPVTNPAPALLSESKRFPLVWESLRERLPTWRRLLPETRDPRDAPWRGDDSWVIKSAFCNSGDTVMTRGITPAALWRKAAWDATWRPGGWIAQRRFEPVRIDTPLRRAFPCLGVYTVNGRAAGIYGRLTTGHLIDYAAIDAAVLVEDSGEEAQ